MGAFTDLWKSERGVVAVALIIAATVLAALGHMTIADWQDYSWKIFMVYAGTKAVTSSVGMWTESKTRTAAAEGIAAIGTARATAARTGDTP